VLVRGAPLRKAVVLDKSGTIVDACRVLLDLKSGEYLFCENTLKYVTDRGEALVNVRGPLKRIMDGRTEGLSLKVSCSPWHGAVKIDQDLLLKEGVMEGLRDVTDKVKASCESKLGVCAALLVRREGEVTHAVGLGGRLYPEVKGVVRSLAASGTDVFLATGNCREASIKCARLLGIPKEFVLFDADPQEKMELVRKLRGFYGAVIMVGNDVNDLTAMTAADLGIMVRRGDKGGEGDFSRRPEVDYVVPSLKEVETVVSEIKRP
jgi:soluble P-type ATPase